MFSFKTLKPIQEPGMMAHACDPHSQEVEAEDRQDAVLQKTETTKSLCD